MTGRFFISPNDALNRETLASYLLFNCGGFALLQVVVNTDNNILKVTVGQADSQYQGK